MVSLRTGAIAFLYILWSDTVTVSSLPGGGLNLPQLPKIYDFIIVGGGTAGCVLARHLSEWENGKYSVLVLEAGPVPPEILDVPGFAKTNQANPNVTFQYDSVVHKVGLLHGGVVRNPLGRVLGGSSQVNHLNFNRGSPFDYDNWANVTGDPTWKYDSMLEYFKRAETYLGQFPNGKQHGISGPIPVSYHEYAPGRKEWLKAGRELGFFVGDPNGPQKVGFTPVEYSTRNGRRVSSYRGYLLPVMNSRKNLKVVTNAYVTRLNLVGDTAIGVRYNADGSTSSDSPTATLAYAKREIILSSGTFGSSSLLQRSGVGPKRVLRQAGIPLKLDLPVGENLQDHPVVPLHFILNNKSLALDPPTDLTPRNYLLFQKYGQGPYTSVAGYSGQAFLSSSNTILEGLPNWPDIFVAMTAVTTRLPFYRDFGTAPFEVPISIYVNAGRSNSLGNVRVNPRNVDGMPIIDYNYLGDDGTDENILLEGIEATLKIFETTRTYRELGARFPPNPIPGCDDFVFKSRAYWRCYIKQALDTGHHPVGTCSMGRVVDSSLRVLGMKRLRVVDASIMPYVTNANLQAAVYAIAEKAADVILRDHSKVKFESLVNIAI